MLLALTIIFMMLGSIIETGTLFLLAASVLFLSGMIWREFGAGSGVAFWGAGVLLGLFIAPNKFYVITYAVMGLYILIVEIVWLKLGRCGSDQSESIVLDRKICRVQSDFSTGSLVVSGSFVCT